MTGNEFIDLIRKKGSFVRSEDMEQMINFFQSKLLQASCADEEERIVASFGDPDALIGRLRTEYEKLQLPTDPPVPPANEAPAPDEEDADMRVVDSTERDSAVRVTEDTENEDKDVTVFRPTSEQTISTPSEEAVPPRRPERTPPPQKRRIYGITNTLLDRMHLKGKQRTTGKIALSVVFSPLFILLGLGIIALFLLAMAGIVAAAAALLLVETALILVSVVELIYAILAFFTSIPIALIELGLGTVLISLAVAVTALVYQLLTGVIPIAAKKVNRLRKTAFRSFFEIFYGSKGGKA